MPEKATMERAKKDLREGKSPSTAAGEFVREEIEHVREGKHGARSPQQAGDAWAQVDRALTDAVPKVPLVIDGSAVLLSPRVRHYEVDFSGPIFDQLWVT